MKLMKIFVLIILAAFVSTFVGCQIADKETSSVDNVQNASSKQPDGSTIQDSKAGGNSADLVTPQGLPVVKEPVTLTMMIMRTPDQTVSFKDMLAIQELEKRTGVHIEWIEVPQTALAERRNLAMATGDLPDAFIRCGFPLVDQIKYGEQGEILALNDLIEYRVIWSQFETNF